MKSNKTGSHACIDSEFACDDNLCIRKDSVCDGIADCEDQTDEADCPAPETEGLSNKFNC